MTTLEMALKPFEGRKVRNPEIVEEIEFERDELVEKTLETYMHLRDIYDWNSLETKSKKLSYDSLSPFQMDIVLQKIIQNRNLKSDGRAAGLMMAKLLQKSYNSGYNDFALATRNSFISHIGTQLKGNVESLLNLTIYGNVGHSFGINSRDSDFTINGDANLWFGFGSENCSFTVDGKTGMWCGADSKNSIYLLYGSVGPYCGSDSYNCLFKTPNEKTYKKLLEMVSKKKQS